MEVWPLHPTSNPARYPPSAYIRRRIGRRLSLVRYSFDRTEAKTAMVPLTAGYCYTALELVVWFKINGLARLRCSAESELRRGRLWPANPMERFIQAGTE